VGFEVSVRHGGDLAGLGASECSEKIEILARPPAALHAVEARPRLSPLAVRAGGILRAAAICGEQGGSADGGPVERHGDVRKAIYVA
jgi:hypothetical protein